MQDRSGAFYRAVDRLQMTLLQIFAIVEADIRKIRHDPWEVVMRMIQPAMWLLLFGQAMSHVQRHFGVHQGSYLDYIAPGVLAQSVLFVSIFYGISLIWERDTGILHKIMVTPAPRVALVLGRAIGAGIRSLFQVSMIYMLSMLMQIDLRLDPLSLLGVLAMVMLTAAIFSTFSLLVATLVKKRERFMGIGQLLTMPFFFASNALYPIEAMPDWIRHLSLINPLSYQIDALRALMITGSTSFFGLTADFLVIGVLFIAIVAIATRFFPKILY